MEVDNNLRMKEGFGENSYAKNSKFQKMIILKANSEIEESIREVYQALLPENFRIADLGCSSGPNSLTAVSIIIDAIDMERQKLNRKAPQIEVYLNDLPGNDFNAIYSLLPSFYQKLEEEKGSDFGPCFVSGTPRSFYGQVFPDHFLHFAHSSNSIHWLSQVPQGLTSEKGEALNKGTIHLSKSSPPEISQAYYAQFKSDFTLFLRSRAKEMVPNGRMILTLQGNKQISDHPGWSVMDSALQSMVSEGIIEEEELDNFNLPFYGPTIDEIKDLVEAQGSFSIKRLEPLTLDWKKIITADHNLDSSADFAAKTSRAATEPLLATTFSEAVIDELFLRFKMRIKEILTQGYTGNNVTILVSLIKR